jgi:hypothetical protein
MHGEGREEPSAAALAWHGTAAQGRGLEEGLLNYVSTFEGEV